MSNIFDFLFTDKSKTQTPAEAQANISSLSKQLAKQTGDKLASGQITPTQAQATLNVIKEDQFTDPGEAASQAFFSGLNPFSSADPSGTGAGVGTVFKDLFILAAIGGALWAFFKFGGVGLLKTLTKKNKWYVAGIVGAAALLSYLIYSEFKKTATDTSQTVSGVKASFASLL